MASMRTEIVLDAPAVLLEACSAFAALPDEPGICAACGWLEDDHAATSEPTSEPAAA